MFARKKWLAAFAPALLLTVGMPHALASQATPLRPVTVGSPMPDFTLPSYQGGEVTLSDLRGKTVVLIFPRGRSRPGSWCHVCNYQHQELVEYEARHGLREGSNVEILFILPYGREELDGWIAEPAPSVYDSETLYEYINGAADLYINYDFQELAALNYEKGEDQGITVDIYRHSTPRNAFGIYSQERPREGAFLNIGTQGYHDTGILNFVLGRYYVKLAGFYLGDEDESLLASIAEEVAGRIEDEAGFPKPVICFPDSGRIAHTERYTAVDFLGHAFLHSAYSAEYEVKDQSLTLFILEGDDEEDAVAMTESYLDLARDKGQEITASDGYHRFKDPYYSSGGSMNLKRSGRYVWGLFSDSAPLYEFYLNEIGEALERNGLIGEDRE